MQALVSSVSRKQVAVSHKEGMLPTCNSILYIYCWASEASPPSHTTGTIFLYICVSSVSPDTVSFLNVSTRFYLGVYAVRNIAILKTVCYTLPLAHNAEAFI